LYVAYKEDPRVAVFLVYVAEAHPAERPFWSRWFEPRGPEDIAQHRNPADRAQAAGACRRDTELTLPILLDTMDGRAKRAYHVNWAATVVVDIDGNLVLYAEGNRGTRPAEAARVLDDLLEERP
jgi:hypothetical protein